MKIEIASPLDKMSESGSSLLRLIQNNDTSRLDLLVRESIQNCLDAGNKSSKCVNVDFISGNAESEKVGSYLDKVQKRLVSKCGETCDFIAIKDTNTVGLTGPIRKTDIGEDGKYGNYLKLVTEISKPQEQTGAGGSWGLGKTVYFRIGIGLVIYYSRIRREDGGFESRLSAALVEDETKKDAILNTNSRGLKRGIAWWGDIDPQDKHHASTIPVTDEEYISGFLSVFGLEPFGDRTTGTMIIIPFINRKNLLDETIPVAHSDNYQTPFWCTTSIEEYIRISIQRWYAPRIQNKEYSGQYLNVSINGSKITHSKMAPIFQLIQNLYNANPNKESAFNGKEISSKPIELRNVFKKGNAQAGIINYVRVTSEDLLMTPPDNLPKPYYYVDKVSSDDMYNDPIVLFTRKPGMIVSYATTGDWTDSIPKCEPGEYIIAIFIVNSSNELAQVDMTLEEYIRQSEKADHKDWNDWVIPGGNPQIIARIQRGVRKKIKDDFTKITIGTEEKKNLGLGRMLAEMLLPPSGFAYWDDAHGGAGGIGGTGGDGSKPKPSSKHETNNTSHVILKQMAMPSFGDNQIEMPIRILLGKKKKASIEVVVDTEGKPINCLEWEKTFGTDYPVIINDFIVTSATKGKGKELSVLIGGETSIASDIKIGNIKFVLGRSKKTKNLNSIAIDTGKEEDVVVDAIMRYSLNGVQGTLTIKE